MAEVLIIADDLSGAADCAAGCAASGLATEVILDPRSLRRGGHAESLAVDTDSREATPEAAAASVGDALARHCGADTRIVYLKIDSTLRGNWASDVRRARRSMGELSGAVPLAVVAPAFPSLGRTTQDGRVLVRAAGAEARVAGDVKAALAATGISVSPLSLDDVRQPADALAAELDALARSGAEAVVADAGTDDDLRRLAAGVLAMLQRALWVGSAGLMRQLGPLLGQGRRPAGTMPPCSGPRLFVIGSASAISRAQVERLTAGTGVAGIRVAPADLAEGNARAGLERQLDAALASGRDVAVEIAGTPVHPGAPLDGRLVGVLAAMLAPRLARVGGLFATGGATARSLLAAAGVTGIRLGGEVQPGMPWGRTVGAVEMPIITKAGAFGSPDTLRDCWTALGGR